MNLEETEALARAATPGPWETRAKDEDPNEVSVVCTNAYPPGTDTKLFTTPYYVVYSVNGDVRTEAELPTVADNAAYLAHMSPDRTLALIEEIKELRTALKPFTHPVFAEKWSGASTVYARNRVELTVDDFERAAEALKESGVRTVDREGRPFYIYTGYADNSNYQRYRIDQRGKGLSISREGAGTWADFDEPAGKSALINLFQEDEE